MSLAKVKDHKLSETEYLEGELISETKYEYIDGEVFAMAGASVKHNIISSNVSRELGNNLKSQNSPCNVFLADMKVKISNNSTHFYYPDVMVVCDKSDEDYFQNSPVIIVEVLSKSTRRNDKTSKKMTYFNIPSLEEYVVIEQDYCEVEVFRKKNGWTSTVYFLGDEITFDSIKTTLSVEDIYYHIDNEDMAQYLAKKEIIENN